MGIGPSRAVTFALAIAGGLAVVGLVVGVAKLSSASPDDEEAEPAGVALLETEVEALTEAGVEPGDPKLEMLQEDLAALQEGLLADPVPEPDGGSGAEPGTAAGAGTGAGADPSGPGPSAPTPQGGVSATGDGQQPAAPDAASGGATGAAVLDDGPVQCEPIPPDLLTVEDIAGATCQSLIQPDGSTLYVATGPDGTEHAVRFAPDGTVTRLP